MASRILASGARALSSPAAFRPVRSFQTSAQRLADAAPLPPRKPVGAFRGGYVATKDQQVFSAQLAVREGWGGGGKSVSQSASQLTVLVAQPIWFPSRHHAGRQRRLLLRAPGVQGIQRAPDGGYLCMYSPTARTAGARPVASWVGVQDGLTITSLG